jgi:hypothetical protein
MSLWSRIRSRITRSAPADSQIRVLDEGFDVINLANGSVAASVRWRDVTRIQAYKLDLVTTDCICLLFEFGPGRASVQLPEEWPGFQELFGPLAQRFPAIPESWYVDIMTPAFETKRTVLFEAPGLIAQPSSNNSLERTREG